MKKNSGTTRRAAGWIAPLSLAFAIGVTANAAEKIQITPSVRLTEATEAPAMRDAGKGRTLRAVQFPNVVLGSVNYAPSRTINQGGSRTGRAVSRRVGADLILQNGLGGVTSSNSTNRLGALGVAGTIASPGIAGTALTPGVAGTQTSPGVAGTTDSPGVAGPGATSGVAGPGAASGVAGPGTSGAGVAGPAGGAAGTSGGNGS